MGIVKLLWTHFQVHRATHQELLGGVFMFWPPPCCCRKTECLRKEISTQRWVCNFPTFPNVQSERGQILLGPNPPLKSVLKSFEDTKINFKTTMLPHILVTRIMSAAGTLNIFYVAPYTCVYVCDCAHCVNLTWIYFNKEILLFESIKTFVRTNVYD